MKLEENFFQQSNNIGEIDSIQIQDIVDNNQIIQFDLKKNKLEDKRKNNSSQYCQLVINQIMSENCMISNNKLSHNKLEYDDEIKLENQKQSSLTKLDLKDSSQDCLSSKEKFKQKLKQNPLNIKRVSCKKFDNNSCSTSSEPSPLSSYMLSNCLSSKHEYIGSKFEELYNLSDIILGEGCQAIVKTCHKQNNKPTSNQLQKQFSDFVSQEGFEIKECQNEDTPTGTPQKTNESQYEFHISQNQINLPKLIIKDQQTSRSEEQKRIKFGESFKEEKYAVKIVKYFDEEIRQIAVKEYNMMKDLDQKNIIQVQDLFQNKKKSTVYMVMEYIEGMSLYEFVKNSDELSEEQICNILRQVLEGVEYLHSDKVGIMHRDLNPFNILIKEDKNNEYIVKIIDFNASRKFFEKDNQDINKKVLRFSNTGNRHFQAPEQVQLKPYNEKIDIWGVGCILFYLLFKQIPFPSKNNEILQEQILNNQQNIQKDKQNQLSIQVKDLLNQLLQIDASKRLSATDALKHQWFN